MSERYGPPEVVRILCLNLERRSVLVDRQRINVNGREPLFGPPKSEASVRLVPLPTVVTDALRAHLQTYPSTTLVFTNNVGAPLRRSAFSTESSEILRTYCGLTGVTKHITAGQSPKSG